MNFKEAVTNSSIIITEGAMVERCRRNPCVRFDPVIAHAGLIYDNNGREILRKLYKQYLDIGSKYDLPIITFTPTWRANPIRLKQSGFYNHKNVNKDCFRFLDEIRKDYSEYSNQIFIGGLMGCHGDAYRPEEALSKDEAAHFHQPQARALTEAGVDFLMAATLPAASEATGIASAMSDCGLPYVLSFVVKANGTLLDGTPLHDAIDQIDSEINPKPYFYMINCVHPSIFQQAIDQETSISGTVGNRLLGFQANTSSKSPEELENLSYLDTTDPEEFADLMLFLHKRFGVKIMGGCCGSDNRHIEEIAKRLSLRCF